MVVDAQGITTFEINIFPKLQNFGSVWIELIVTETENWKLKTL